MNDHILTTDVLVVGAGPTGLMLANCLAAQGVGVLIADGKSGPTHESRALAVQARSMEIYDQLGLAGPAISESTPATALVPGYRTRSFRAVPLSRLGRTVSPYPMVYMLEQSENETLLAGNLAVLGVEPLWEHELRALEIVPDREFPVRADVGGRTVAARYCVGADGASSTVRALRGIRFDGTTNEHSFYVCDAIGVSGLASERINLRVASRDLLLAFPMGPGGHARLLGLVRTSGEPPLDEVEREVRARLVNVFGVRYEWSNWFARYRLHHRIAARFRDGPVFLAGDAAHVHSPVGAQGMNTGLQDAHNLAAKLADVVNGRAADASLDDYEAERRPVAERLVATTDRVFGVVTSERPMPRMLRTVVFPLVAPLASRFVPRLPGASRLFGYLSQTRIRYHLRRPDDLDRNRAVGRRLPWTGENYECLRAMTWQVHTYDEALVAAAHDVAQTLGLDFSAFDAVGDSGLNRSLLYLIRPDGFVAEAVAPADALGRFRLALPSR